METKKLYVALLLIIILAGLLNSPSVFSSIIKEITIKFSGTIRASRAPPLHVDGRWIKDSNGNIVFLRGVNKVGFEDCPDGAWEADGQGGFGVWSPYAVKANLDEMKRWGCNVVRMIQAVDWWINNEPNYKQHIKDIITWAGERGIYVIFTGYQVRNYFAGGGQDPLPYPPYSLTGSETVIPNEQAFINWWKAVATELGTFPNVIFELWNEPHSDEWPENPAPYNSWKQVSQQCVDAIRTVSDNIIIIQWDYDVWWNEGGYNNLDWIQDFNIRGSNILYSTHTYPDGLGAPDSRYITYAHMSQVLNLTGVKKVGEQWNKPLIIGEIGANLWWTGNSLTNELSAFKNELAVFNDWDLSYIGWAWYPIGVGAYPLLVDGLDPSKAGQILIDAIASGGTGRPSTG